MSRFNKTKSIGILFFMSLCLILVACQKDEEKVAEPNKEEQMPKEKEVVKIYIKSDLEPAFEEIVQNFENANEDIDLEPVFLSNEEILENVKNDTSNSVVFTTEDTVRSLIDDDYINYKDTKFLMLDELVLFTKDDEDAIQRTKDMDENTRVAILNPDEYEEGELSRAIFNDDDFENVDRENFVIGNSSEDVIQDVMNNNAQVGVLYQSEVYRDDDLRTMVRAPRRVVEPFIYQLGLVKKDENASTEKVVYDYLLSQEVQEILSKYGYVV